MNKADEAPATVMLIDDDERFIARLTAFIERMCHLSIVDTASSAEEALQRAGTVRPAFIITDISMGGMSGIDAIAPLKEASPSSKVIVVSSLPSEYEVVARARGANGYVEKRRIADDLPRLLRSLC